MTAPIVELTPTAYEHIRSLVDRMVGQASFRVLVKKPGCSGLMCEPGIVDAPQEGDVAIEIDKNLVILLNSPYLSKIKGIRIDYISKGLGQHQLQFNILNAISACGCGESFYLEDNG